MLMLVLGGVHLLMFAGVVGALGWVYRHTRQTAVVAYTAWFLASQLLFPYGNKLIVDFFLRSGSRLPHDMSLGVLMAAVSAITNVIGCGMLIWLLVSLVRWAVPGLPLPWERRRIRTRVAVER
jgi:hypothetical protein